VSLQQRYNTAAKPVEKRLLTPQQSVMYVGLSIDKIYEMIRDREISYIIRPTSGSRPRFMIDRFDWDRWIEKRKISAL
jgi:hypothetical protein